MTDTDDTDDTPSVRRTVLELLRQHPDGVSDDLLVATVADRADASAFLARTTVGRLEREGMIYAVGDDWKVTEP